MANSVDKVSIQCQRCGIVVEEHGYQLPEGWAEEAGLFYCEECIVDMPWLWPDDYGWPNPADWQFPFEEVSQ